MVAVELRGAEGDTLEDFADRVVPDDDLKLVAETKVKDSVLDGDLESRIALLAVLDLYIHVARKPEHTQRQHICWMFVIGDALLCDNNPPVEKEKKRL